MNAASSSHTETASRPAKVVEQVVACEDELIRTPEAIQPYGFLLALDAETLVVERASANAADSLGLSMEEIFGAPADRVLVQTGEVSDLLSRSDLAAWLRGVGEREALSLPQSIGADGVPFHLVAHRAGAWIVLEGEPTQLESDLSSARTRVYPSTQTALNRLESAENLEALCDVVVREVRRITGLHRVQIYRFDADWSGQVVAECRDEDVSSHLGLHFPAADIPGQARALYLEDRFRFIADADYTAIPIVSAMDAEASDAASNTPLDLSRSVLRSVSPVHLEYLRNMGVHASLSASLIQNGQLWGLIVGHHTEPIYLPYPARAACGFVAQMMSLLLRTELSAAELRAGHRHHHVQRSMLDQLLTGDDLGEALTTNAPTLLDLIDAEGAVLYDAGHIHSIGTTPSEEQLHDLVDWLDEQAVTERDGALPSDSALHDAGVFSTDALAHQYSPAEAYSALGSGLMAISLSQLRRYYVLWFRAEAPQTVFWAGNPAKAVEPPAGVESTDGEPARLHPRHSFERWRELRRGTSRPWSSSEAEAAAYLKRVITEVIFVKTDQAARLNATLARSNDMLLQRTQEMEEFAYVASHDLQEPLRKIRTFAELLEDEYGEGLGEGARDYLDRLSGAAERMSDLIRDLLAYSRVVTRARPFVRVDLNQTIASVRLACEDELRARGGRFEVAGPLPTIEAEPLHLEQLFGHLVSNALKFTPAGTVPHVRIRVETVDLADFDPAALPDPGGDGLRAEPVAYSIFVQDSGMGFDEKYLDRIFVPFQRLAARGEHAGTGIGLALCKRIAQHHGGSISATSVPGHGSTFVVTLPRVQA